MGTKRAPPAPVLGIYLLGVLIVVLAVLQVATATSSTAVLVVETALPLASAGAVVYGGSYIQRRPRRRERATRVLVAAVLLVGVGELVVGADFLVSHLADETNANPAFPAVAVFAVASAVSLPVGLYYDEAVTKRAELECELERARSLNEQLDTVNQRLLVMNRVVRHNLRTELTLLNGYYERFREEVDGTEMATGLEACRECIDSLGEIERKTTYIDRLGRMDVEAELPDSTDVTETVERVAESARRNEAGMDLSVEAPDDAFVPDHPLLQTVLTELVTNAVTHNDASALRVDLRVTRPSPDAVEVVVADTGSGIPDHELVPLQAGQETPLVHASGVGLWLVKWVVSEMDGTLSFEPNEPRGTRVVMRFPRREPSARTAGWTAAA